ncbi:hypothetical protein EJ110_NYTH25631 [Nymphaea thermarum]|nr:hypothetical protein EJ110_NYTH25631 [Nymphaea thermarum]
MKSSPFSSLITKMNGGNYEMWAMQVKRTLIAHDKEHLISEPKPVQKVGKYTTWFKDNSLVMVWIVGTLSQDIANEVLHKESAKDMWDSLAATYSQARNETRIMQLHHDIHQMRQDGRPLHTYYSSLKFMFERLNSYFPACKCEQQKAYRDMLMVGVFLSGLDSVYESAKNQMLTSPSIPPIDEAYSRLSRIPIPAATIPDTTSAMLANRGRGGSFFPRGRGGCGRGPPTSRPVCQFCHRIGHTVDKCWQKHGRPAFANQTTSTESSEQPKAQHTAPSSELRVDDLLPQLRSLIGDRPQHAPDPTTTTVTTAASASSSGMYSAYTACPATDTTDWLIDSGASTHLCGDKAQFTSYVKRNIIGLYVDGEGLERREGRGAKQRLPKTKKGEDPAKGRRPPEQLEEDLEQKREPIQKPPISAGHSHSVGHGQLRKEQREREARGKREKEKEADIITCSRKWSGSAQEQKRHHAQEEKSGGKRSCQHGSLRQGGRRTTNHGREEGDAGEDAKSKTRRDARGEANGQKKNSGNIIPPLPVE